MITDIKSKVKKCLHSFGYRELRNESNIFTKPLCYFNMVAYLNENSLLIKTIFRNATTNDITVYNSKEIKFDEINVDDLLSLSHVIANLECDVLGSGSVIYTGQHDKPWNFLKLEETINY